MTDDYFNYEPKNFEKETFRQSDEIVRATTCLVLPTGAGLPFCSLDHSYLYAKSFDKGLGDYRLGQTSSKVKYCSHCVMCGKIIRRPPSGTCMIHGGEEPEQCPDVDVYGTFFQVI